MDIIAESNEITLKGEALLKNSKRLQFLQANINHKIEINDFQTSVKKRRFELEWNEMNDIMQENGIPMFDGFLDFEEM